MQKLEFIKNTNLKYINGKIYFEDKIENASQANKDSDKKRKLTSIKKLTDKDLTNFFINLKIDISTDSEENNVQTHKFKVDSKTTAFNLIEKLGKQVYNSTINKEYEPKKKILKVLSRNDYIFEVNEALINFQYINDCVKSNKIPEYLVIDNPALLELNIQQSGSNNKNNSSSNINTSIDIVIPCKLFCLYTCSI
jgi:hypothetical protein